MAKKIYIPFPVPTSTIIAYSPDDPYLVWLIEQAVKHKGRWTLVGGRCTLPGQDHETCILEEWAQEAGGKGAVLKHLRPWIIKNDRAADPRKTTLGKVTDNQCPKRLINQAVLGLYGCPDQIYLGQVEGEPYPSDGEAKRCFIFDTRELVITETAEESKFGANHDVVLGLYRRWLDGRKIDVYDEAITSVADIRQSLLQLQANGWRTR